MTEQKIAYEVPPVSPERKAELRAQGYTILDAQFAPPGYEPVASAPKALSEEDQFERARPRAGKKADA